jgi:hypothetical protein
LLLPDKDAALRPDPVQRREVGSIGIDGEDAGRNAETALSVRPDVKPAKLVGNPAPAFTEPDNCQFRGLTPRYSMIYYVMKTLQIQILSCENVAARHAVPSLFDTQYYKMRYNKRHKTERH